MSKKTLTGALSELYRQRVISLLIESLSDQIAQLEESLALKNNKQDVDAQILELHEQGKSIRDIASATGMRKSTAHDRLQRALRRV